MPLAASRRPRTRTGRRSHGSICDRWEVLVLISAVMITIAAISQVAYAADSTGVASWTASFGETAPVAGGGRT